MYNIIFIFFRGMRLPLLSLVVVFSITALGLTLIPGEDPDGNVWYMSFFHAIYFVSYMSTTIGFGEVPYPFNDAQRLWVVLSIYSSVISWLYAIGTLLTLIQDKTFQQALRELSFSRKIRYLTEPFYIVCGYGETGCALVSVLTERNQNAVVIDIDPDVINLLKLQNLRQFVPGLHGDASRPIHLIEAGLEHPLCQGIIAVTDNNDVNLKIALTSKLLNPQLKVICRADSHEIEDNMSSFGTDYIIDPFDTFAIHLATAIQSPALNLLNMWLTGARYEALDHPIYPPQKGRWIICGYGRFGKTVYRQLKNNNINPFIIEASPDSTGLPTSDISPDDWIKGWGTDAITLDKAGIRDAVGIIAGTDNDSNNLSIIMTAKTMNPDLFVVARNNMEQNTRLFDAIKADIVMHPSSIIADKISGLLATPLLYAFMGLAHHQTREWASEMVKRTCLIVKEQVPEVWELVINDEQALAVFKKLAANEVVTIGHILCNPRQRDEQLFAMPLLLQRSGILTLLPDEGTPLEINDKLLLSGRLSSRYKMEWTLLNKYALEYILYGEKTTHDWFSNLLSRAK
jgi:Trk K+ transport system NAD-binding subunit